MSSLADSNTAGGFERTSLKIPSITPLWNLDAWRYLPKQGPSPLPVIIMAHGFSANKLMGLAPFAEEFAALGYACLVFDYRRWGHSDGVPRHSVYVSEQLDDYRTIVKYCRQQPEFDPQRVILWGSSFSGGHVTILASETNLNIYAVIAECPYMGIGIGPSLTVAFIKIAGYAILDLIMQAVGFGPVYIPAVAHPGEVGILNTPTTFEGMHSLVKEEGDYPNEVSASSVLEFPFFTPYTTAKNIVCPILVIGLEKDNLCYIEGSARVARDAPRSEFVKLDGHHFDVYPGNRLHEAALNAQTAFLKKHVPV